MTRMIIVCVNGMANTLWHHLHRKQAHLYANVVTVSRKSLFYQTICDINNNDFVGMSINLN